MGVGVHASVTVTNESLSDRVIKREIRMYDRKDAERDFKIKNWQRSRAKSYTGNIRGSDSLILLIFYNTNILGMYRGTVNAPMFSICSSTIQYATMTL